MRKTERGYDLVLLGRAEAARIDLDQLQDRLSARNYERVRQSLKDAGFRSVFALLSTYGGTGRRSAALAGTCAD